MNPQRPRQRLYLVTPQIDDTASFAHELEAALSAGDIAAVLLRLAAADERTLVNRAKAIAAIVQRRDVALLLDGHTEIVGRVGADGAHLSGIEAFAAALALLKPDRIAGAGALRSRHDAMLAAETGADYVMFGEPDATGRQPGHDAIIERVEWWAELFEVPCVGFADSLDQVARLSGAGADFVAVGDLIWNDGKAADKAMRAVAEHLLLEPSPWR